MSTDDPREILRAAGVECPEVEAYLAEPDEVVDARLGDGTTVPMKVWNVRPDHDAAILALALLTK